MARSIILGNGKLTVGLDENGLVHDFYYPYVGLENLTTSRSVHHKIGVWVDGDFSWVDDGSWDVHCDFSDEALISDISFVNSQKGVEIKVNDFVDIEYDVFCRRLTVKNTGSDHKSIRLFMHQVFQISSAGRADTVLYEPAESYILDYKGRCCLLISGNNDEDSFDQYAVGNYGIEGKQGTFVDAEDGELSGHAVEHGGVDSVVRFSLELEPNQEKHVDYWVIADDSQYACEKLHKILKENGLSERLEMNRKNWKNWLERSDEKFAKLPQRQRSLARKSLMIIKAHIDRHGGIIASCDSSIYNYGRDYYSYVWPRDGGYAVWPLIKLGYIQEAKAFLKFCVDVQTSDGYMMHKYQPDRAIGSTWHPLVHNRRKELAIQEDETAILIIILGELNKYSNEKEFVEYVYKKLVIKAADFMINYVDASTNLPHASYDLWEEKFLTNVYTTATVYRALNVAADLAKEYGDDDNYKNWENAAMKMLDHYPSFVNPSKQTYYKGFLLNDDGTLDYDETVDISSMYGVIKFGYYPEGINPNEPCQNLIDILQSDQFSGFSRYEKDGYFMVDNNYGNPWLVTTLWVAQYYAMEKKFDKAYNLIDWVEKRALSSGVMPEQVDPRYGTPISVTPLVWSHAEYINTLLCLMD